MRSVIVGGMGLRSPAEVVALLESHLFSEVIPASDAGNVPTEAADALVDLYQRLTEGEQESTHLLAMTVHELLKIPGMSDADPIGAIAFALHKLVVAGHITPEDATEITSLPWQAAAKTLTGANANQLMSFVVSLRWFAHEMEEGFIEPATRNAQLYEEAKSVSQILRPVIDGSSGDSIQG